MKKTVNHTVSDLVRRAIIRGLAISCIVTTQACAPSAFNLSYPDNNLEQIKRVQSRTSDLSNKPVNVTGEPLAFVVTDKKPSQIITFDLTQKKTVWTVEADATSRIAVGQQLLFHRSGKNLLVARDVRTGAMAWQHDRSGTSDGTRRRWRSALLRH